MKLRKITLLLALVFLLSTFYSCSTESDENPKTTIENTEEPSDKGVYVPKTFTVQKDSKTKNGITITWETKENFYYNIYYNTEKNTETAKILNKRAFSGSYSTTLDSTRTYYFWIRACKWSGTEYIYSDFSNAVSYDFTHETTLIAPTNLAVAESSTTLNTLDLSWDKVDGVKYYWIFYSTENDSFTAKYYDDAYSNKKSITLSESGTYYFWVKSADSYYSSYGNNSECSDFSDAVSYEFTYKTLIAPTNLKVEASSTTLNTLDLSWDKVDGVKYYWIFYSTENDSFTAKYYDDAYSNKKSITLSESGTYYFWVKSADSYYSSYGNNSECSDFSNMSQFNFTHKELSAPLNLKATKYDYSSKGIQLEWDSANARYYHIYWATENDSAKAKYLDSTSLNKDVISEEYNDLKTGTTYYFWVKSADSYYSSSGNNSCSTFSEPVSFTYQ